MSRKQVKGNKEELVYCSQMHCNHTDCLRNKANTPWGVLVQMKKFEIDKNGKCKDKLEK